MNQCCGIVVNEKSIHYNKQCPLMCDDIYCEYHKCQQNNSKYFIKIMHILVKQCIYEPNRKNKINLVKRLFDLIIKNKIELKKHHNVAKTIVEKLQEFKKEYDFDADYYYNMIFTDMDSIYI